MTGIGLMVTYLFKLVKMKITNVKKEESSIVIDVEEKIKILGVTLKTKKRQFIANREYPAGYWNWLEMPEMTWIDSILSFKLDELLRHHNKRFE